MQDVTERDEEQAMLLKYSRPKEAPGNQMGQDPPRGFVVRGAPWSASDDFPSLGGGVAAPGGAGGRQARWGPSSHGPNLPRI